METLGIIGMGVGAMGRISAMTAVAKTSKLEKQLQETGVRDKEYKSD